jgi:hypothetical protein
MAAIVIAAGVLVHPPRWRHAFWMDARGLTQWRSDAYSRMNEWSHVGWHDIRDVHVFNGRGAGLEVLSSRDDGIGVHDRPARPQTAAFIQAALREAERHPRVERQPHRPLYPVPLLEPFDPAEARQGRGCMERFLLILVSVTAVPVVVLLAVDELGLLVLVPAEFIALALVVGFTGFRLWLKLHDSDLAYAHRGGRSFRRHTRNRLRRLLGIHDA